MAVTSMRTSWARWLTAMLIAGSACAGCNSIRNWHGDEWANPEYVLKIEVPPSATNVEKSYDADIGYQVTFYLPNDQWRAYIAKYYPSDAHEQGATPTEEQIARPAFCDAATNPGPTMTRWVAGAKIPYLKSSDQTAMRRVSIVPNCRPDQAHVSWTLIPPSPS